MYTYRGVSGTGGWKGAHGKANERKRWCRSGTFDSGTEWGFDEDGREVSGPRRRLGDFRTTETVDSDKGRQVNKGGRGEDWRFYGKRTRNLTRKRRGSRKTQLRNL